MNERKMRYQIINIMFIDLSVVTTWENPVQFFWQLSKVELNLCTIGPVRTISRRYLPHWTLSHHIHTPLLAPFLSIRLLRENIIVHRKRLKISSPKHCRSLLNNTSRKFPKISYLKIWSDLFLSSFTSQMTLQ